MTTQRDKNGKTTVYITHLRIFMKVKVMTKDLKQKNL